MTKSLGKPIFCKSPSFPWGSGFLSKPPVNPRPNSETTKPETTKPESDTTKPKECTKMVTTNEVTARKGPGIFYKKIGKIAKGTEVCVIRKVGSWAQLKDDSLKNKKYVSKNNLKAVPAEKPKESSQPKESSKPKESSQPKESSKPKESSQAQTPKEETPSTEVPETTTCKNMYTTTSLNIRADPSTNNPKIKTVAEGTKLCVVKIENGWALLDDKTYASAQYLTETKPTTSTDHIIVQEVNTTPGEELNCNSNKYSCSYGFPIFGQKMPAWGNTVMTPGTSTLGKVGCAITSASIVLSKIVKKVYTPLDITQCVSSQNGFDSTSSITSWAMVGKCAGASQMSVEYNLNPTTLASYISANKGVIMQVNGHFMAVTHADGNNVSINDPCGNAYTIIMKYDGSKYTGKGCKEWTSNGRFIVFAK